MPSQNQQVLIDTEFADVIRDILTTAQPRIGQEAADRVADRVADALLTDETIRPRLTAVMQTMWLPSGDVKAAQGRLHRALSTLPASSAVNAVHATTSRAFISVDDLIALLAEYTATVNAILQEFMRDREALAELREQRRAVGQFLDAALVDARRGQGGAQ